MAFCQLCFLAIVVIGALGDKMEEDVLSQATLGVAASSESKAKTVFGEERALDLGTLYPTQGSDEPLRPRSFGGTKRVTQFIVTGPGKRLGGDEKPSIAAMTPVGSPAASQSDATSAAETGPSALIGEACSSNTSCLVANSGCFEGECRCLNNHITFGSAACLRRSNFLGDTCYVTQQCTHLHSVALCYQGRCLCEPMYYVAGRPCIPASMYDAIGQGGTMTSAPAPSCARTTGTEAKVGQACCDHNQCRYNVWNSHCQAGTCQCDSGYVNIGNQMCVRFASALGDACSVDAQCAQIANSECNQSGTCGCQGRFTPRTVATRTERRMNKRQTSSNDCLPLRNLGESCEVDRQCQNFTRNAVCTNSVCACANNFVVRDQQVNECLPVLSTLNSGLCTISAQCGFSGTICNSTTNTCSCNNRLSCESSGACLTKVGLGGTCSNVCQCTTANATCSTTCLCPSGTEFDQGSNSCIDLTLFPGESPYTFFFRPCCLDSSLGVGAVARSGASTCPAATVAFSGDTTGLTLGTDGTIIVPSSATLTGNSTLTATLTCSSSASLTATTTVSLIADACCAEAPSALLLTSTTVMLADGDPVNGVDPLSIGCAGTDATAGAPGAAPRIAFNADDILDFTGETVRTSASMRSELDIYTNSGACGQGTTVDSVTTTAACPATEFVVQSPAMIDFFSATELGSGATAMCPLQVVLSACNGLTLTSTFTLTVMCPVGT